MERLRGEIKLDTNTTIDDLLLRHPRAAAVFIRRKMLCVGCPAAGFHTLTDAAKLYGYQLEELSAEIALACDAHASRSRSVRITEVRNENQGGGQ